MINLALHWIVYYGFKQRIEMRLKLPLNFENRPFLSTLTNGVRQRKRHIEQFFTGPKPIIQPHKRSSLTLLLKYKVT